MSKVIVSVVFAFSLLIPSQLAFAVDSSQISATSLRLALNVGQCDVADISDESLVDLFSSYISSQSFYTDELVNTINLFVDGYNSHDIYNSPGWSDYVNCIKYIQDTWTPGSSVDWSDMTVHGVRAPNNPNSIYAYSIILKNRVFLLGGTGSSLYYPSQTTLQSDGTLLVSSFSNNQTPSWYVRSGGKNYGIGQSGSSPSVVSVADVMYHSGLVDEFTVDNLQYITNVVYQKDSSSVPRLIPMITDGVNFYGITWDAYCRAMASNFFDVLANPSSWSSTSYDPLTRDGLDSAIDYVVSHRYDVVDLYDYTLYAEQFYTFLNFSIADDYVICSSFVSEAAKSGSILLGSYYLYGTTVLSGEAYPLAIKGTGANGAWGLQELPKASPFLVGIDNDITSQFLPALHNNPPANLAFVAPGYYYANDILQDWGSLRILSSFEASQHNAVPVSWVVMSTPGIITGDDSIVGGSGAGDTVKEGVDDGSLADVKAPRPSWARRFPLSLPWDFQDLFYLFRASPVAPSMTFIYPGSDVPVTFDLTPFTPVSIVLRTVLTVAAALGLIRLYMSYVGLGGDG